MSKLGEKILLSMFLLFIFGFGIAIVVLEDKPSSYFENRALAQRPELTLEGIKDGSFTSAYDTYVTDQFPLRDGWVLSHLLIQKYTNQTFLFDYYETEDHYVLAKPLSYFAADNITQSIQSMNELGDFAKEKEIELYFFNLPSRILTLEEMYPDVIEDGYTDDSQQYLFNNITNEYVRKLDFTQLWKEKYTIDELKTFYYQTDHHWNEEGALLGYETIHNELNATSQHMNTGIFKNENYSKVCANESMSYLGSYNLQLFKLIRGHEDKPCHYVSTQMAGSDFEIYLGSKETGTPIAFEHLFGTKMNLSNENITYAYVFMNDYARIDETNTKNSNGSKALIIKDSFANAINFLVAENYEETTIIDVRYYTEQSVYDLIEENHFDTIMILYNGETIFSSMYNFNWNK